MSGEMECTGEPYGIIYWAGTHGTGRDIPFHQAPTLLNYKDYVASTMPEIERALALNDMKQWICCILQCCDNAGEPFEGPLFPALFLNDIPTVTAWICTGEKNKDDVFHIHAMLKTTSRADSVRRSMLTVWQNLTFNETICRRFGRDAQLELIKLQKCHRPSSMLKYIMKSPTWVLSNQEPLLQLAYDLDIWNMNEKYKKQTEPPTDVGDMNAMVKDLIDVITTGSCKSLEDCLRTNPAIMAKYLHRQGLQQILANCIAFTKATGQGWNISKYSSYPPCPEPIHAILLHQGLNPSACDLMFWQWINKLDTKRNCICIYGPSNTGKSTFIAGIKPLIPWGEAVNGNTFAFEAIVDNVICIWEEPLISPELAEKTKQIMEGMPCSVAIKYKAPKVIPRTPMLITTNHWPWRFCQSEEEAMRNRMWIWPFMHTCKDDPLTYRTSEYSCKCHHCTASRGCSSPHGESSAGRVQRANEPLSTGEHRSIRTQPSGDVGSGPMSDPGEGTSKRYSRQPSSSSGESDIECAERSRPGSRSSSPAGADIRGYGIVTTRNTGNRDDRPITGHVLTVESTDHPGHHGHDSGGDGERPSGKRPFKRRHGGTTENPHQHHSSVSLGLRQKNIQTEKVPVPAKQPTMDREVVPVTNALTIPSSQDWARYLSWLLKRYGG
nr:NS1 [Mute swan feces associated chapparvovirus 4]